MASMGDDSMIFDLVKPGKEQGIGNERQAFEIELQEMNLKSKTRE